MGSRSWAAWGAVAVAVAALMALSGLAPQVLTPTASHPGALPAPVGRAALSAADRAIESQLASALEFTPAQLAGFDGWYSALSPAQVRILHAAGRDLASGAPAGKSVLASLDVTTEAEISYYCLGASIVAGVAIGAGIGSLGSPVGTLIGGVIGAVAGGIGGYYSCQVTSATATTGQYHAWAEALVSALGNEANLTWGGPGASALMSSLNVSLVGWERAADNAATLQLANSSFSLPLDLLQSTVAYQLDQADWAYLEETAFEVRAFVMAFQGGASANGIYTGQGAVLCFAGGGASQLCGAFTGAGSNPPATTGGYFASLGVPISAGSWAFIPGGANVTGQAGDTVTLTPLDGSPARTVVLSSPAGSYYGYGLVPTRSSDVYSVSISNAGTQVLIPGAGQIPSSASLGTGSELLGAATNCGLTTSYGYASIMMGGNSLCLTQGAGAGSGLWLGLGGTSWISAGILTTPGYSGATLPEEIGSLEYQAGQSGEIYWQFLRGLGYNSSSQIPADCLVPAPYLVLPSALNETTLTISEWESLYLGALQAMGNFYNQTNLSATSFCGSQHSSVFHVGTNTPWGNLAINATGYVYLNSGTGPVSLTGAALSSEAFGNYSTWAVGGNAAICPAGETAQCLGAQQLLLMPTLSTVSIPVGVRWAVPAGDPVDVYVIQSGQYLSLKGNGTGNASSSACTIGSGRFCPAVAPLATLAPGDSIYLTSCTVSGSAETNCTVSVQSLNVTVENITCNGPCYQNQTGGGFTWGGLPNPFSWLSNLLGGLFGGGPLGQFLGSVAAGLLILGVIAVIAYVAVVEVTGRGKRDGGGPGGGR